MYLFLYFFLVIQSLIRCFIKCCSLRECSPTLWLAMSDVCKSNNKSPTPTRAYVHVHAQQFFPKCSPALNKAGVVKKLLQNKKYSGAVLSVLVLFDFFFLIRGSFFYDEEMLFCFLFFFWRYVYGHGVRWFAGLLLLFLFVWFRRRAIIHDWKQSYAEMVFVAVVAVEEKKKRDAIKWHPFFFEKFEKYKRCRKESTQMFSRNNFHVKKDRRYCPLLPSTQTTTTTTFV